MPVLVVYDVLGDGGVREGAAFTGDWQAAPVQRIDDEFSGP